MKIFMLIMIIMIIISKVILINLSVMWIASIAAPGLAKTRELGQYTFYIIIHDHLGWFLGNLVSTPFSILFMMIGVVFGKPGQL